MNDTLTSGINEVTMLVIGCRNEVVIIFDPKKPKRGWSFPSAQVIGDAYSGNVAIEAACKKIGFNAGSKSVNFIKAKEKNGIPFSSFFVELTPQEFSTIKSHGPRGHAIRKVAKEALSQYLDRGRYDMAAAKLTGIATR